MEPQVAGGRWFLNSFSLFVCILKLWCMKLLGPPYCTCDIVIYYQIYYHIIVLSQNCNFVSGSSCLSGYSLVWSLIMRHVQFFLHAAEHDIILFDWLKTSWLNNIITCSHSSVVTKFHTMSPDPPPSLFLLLCDHGSSFCLWSSVSTVYLPTGEISVKCVCHLCSSQASSTQCALTAAHMKISSWGPALNH